MHKLNKSEFMQRVINDYYNKKRFENERKHGVDVHSIQNINKTKDFSRRRYKWLKLKKSKT